MIGDETDERIGRILDQIKEERREEERKKERKRAACDRLWTTLDPLMQLDPHKFHEDHFTAKTEGHAERLTRDLLHRNHCNQKAISAYIRHSEYKFKTALLPKRSTNSACLDSPPPPRVAELTEAATETKSRNAVNTRYRRLWRRGERDGVGEGCGGGAGEGCGGGAVEHKMSRSQGAELDRKGISSRRNIAKCVVMDASEFFTS